ncbi:kinetochore protein SPC25 homolog [Dioscorea cayenensis subsp. rotundata]|uniref:Kinetochore protein SPC25 n=1 Tax=Dioscorea cayennensis subsp. rotundata TaxID=55577 RepID=A0AB40AUW7_DIOCR|nr:kinetochore protein SPC25 homolog [Dioscorea cayenensis subsp. rotundata]
MQRRMAELRESCAVEIGHHTESAGLAADYFNRSLLSLRSATSQTLAHREKLGKLKDYLSDLEADLEQILAVNSRKEAKHASTVESLSSTVNKIEELKEIVKDQREKKDAYASIIRQQLHALTALEEKCDQEISNRESIEEAILWYSRVLGFRTEGGEGVKFIFDKIDVKRPEKEYSFTVRLDGDVCDLLHCDPHLENLDKLIKDMNETNGLFKFVRLMREKFQAAALNGISPKTPPVLCYPDTSSVSLSSPPPISVDSRSGTLGNSDHLHHQPKQWQHNSLQRIGQHMNPSPRSISNHLQSPHF